MPPLQAGTRDARSGGRKRRSRAMGLLSRTSVPSPHWKPRSFSCSMRSRSHVIKPAPQGAAARRRPRRAAVTINQSWEVLLLESQSWPRQAVRRGGGGVERRVQGRGRGHAARSREARTQMARIRIARPPQSQKWTTPRRRFRRSLVVVLRAESGTSTHTNSSKATARSRDALA